jgi:dihydrofolate reductase
MSLVIGDITVSLDGFVTGPGADREHGLGHGADGLHAWALDSDHPVDRGVLARHTAASGAVVMGRRTFDTVDGGWSAERGYGADQDGPTRPPRRPEPPPAVEPAPHPRRPSGHCHTPMPQSALDDASTAGNMINHCRTKDRG